MNLPGEGVNRRLMQCSLLQADSLANSSIDHLRVDVSVLVRLLRRVPAGWAVTRRAEVLHVHRREQHIHRVKELLQLVVLCAFLRTVSSDRCREIPTPATVTWVELSIREPVEALHRHCFGDRMKPRRGTA